MMLASVIASGFEFETAQRNFFTFDADVSGQFTKDDLTVWNLSGSTEPTLDRAKLALANTTANTWALTFPGYTYAAVPDGNYETIIEKPDLAGTPDGHVLPFWFYSADFNRDRRVDIADFSILSSNLHTNQTYSGGDTTYDGLVNFDDFSIMAAKFNMSLNPPPTELNDLSLCGMADPVTLDPFIRLTWTVPAPGDPPRLGYRIWRSTDGVNFGSVYAEINDPDATSFDDIQVSEGTHYWYRVRPFSAAGNAHTTPKRDMITPLKMPFDLQLRAASATAIDLSWRDRSTVNTQFIIYRSDDGGKQYQQIATTTDSRYRDTGLSPATEYHYYIQAWSTTSSSMPTAPQAITTPPAGGFQLLASSSAPDRIQLSWNPVSGAAIYEIWASFDGVDFGAESAITRLSSVTEFEFEEAEQDAPLYFKVEAVDGNGAVISTSDLASATTLRPAPGDPGFATALLESTSVSFSWTAADPHAEYFVVQRKVNSGPFADRAIIDGDVFEYADASINSTDTFTYRVKAVNAAGESGFSEEAIAAPAQAPDPDPPPPQRKFLISFYGADPFDVDIQGNVDFLEFIQQTASLSYGYETLNPNPGHGNGDPGDPYRDFHERKALVELLGAIDANDDGRIQQAEADAVEVRLLAWSLGAVSAVNLSRRLRETTFFVPLFSLGPRFKLDAPIQIQDMVLIDTVHDGAAPLTGRFPRGPVESNVTSVRHYFQRRGGTSPMDFWLLGGYPSPFLFRRCPAGS